MSELTITPLSPAEPARLIPAPPGTGKTEAAILALCKKGTRCIYAAPTHGLCQEVQSRMEARGIKVHYWREGPDEDDACPHAELVAFFRACGYLIRRGPCQHCAQRNTCAYRKVFTCAQNRRAQVLLVTNWHLRRSDFWHLRAAENRPLLILDEDACEAIAAPVEVKTEALVRFVANLQVIRDGCDASLGNLERSETVAWLIRRLMKPEDGAEAELALTDILRRACLDLIALCNRSDKGGWVKSPPMERWLSEPDRRLLEQDELFERLLTVAYEHIAGKVELPNLFGSLRELLRNPQPVHASRGAIRWPTKVAIPHRCRITLLDAAAEPSVVEGLLGRPVEVLAMPPVQQQAQIIQIQDRLFTRSATRREVAIEDGLIRTFAGEVARKHQADRLLVVTFLEHEQELADFMQARHPEVTVVHYGALRGLDKFSTYGAGLIIGRPMPNEARLSLLAVSAFGLEALDANLKPPELAWGLKTHALGHELWTVRCQRYADPHWHAVWQHVVTGEILQAIGRLRPLSNPATIYLLTNEPVPPVFDMRGAYANEVFPPLVTASRRADFRANVRRYADAMRDLQGEGKILSNAEVCEKLNISQRNGLRYRDSAIKLLPEGGIQQGL